MNIQKFQTPSSECRDSGSRRGITLLFVISIIVLFLLMGTTFVVVSNDYLRAARRRSLSGGVNAGAVTREQGQQLVVQSFLDAVRGPSLDNEDNPLRGHDLLGDMYGFGIEATIEGTPNRYRGSDTPFIRLFVTEGVSLLTGDPEPLQDIPGHYAGQVLTVTSGEFAGLTARIIQHIPPSVSGAQEHEVIVHPIDGMHGVSGSLDGMEEQSVIINGKAFAGTGAGQFDTTVSVDMPALESKADNPNLVNETREDLLGDNTPATDDNGYLTRWEVNAANGMLEERPNHSSINEPWDAVDFQNMMLAGIVDSMTAGAQGALDADEITPSFYRASLSGNEDFSAFSTGGTAPTRNAVIVVDNDNDSIADGIWIDTGLPIRSTPDGEYIKPLVSYLILDMGGRLNLNAHGNLSESDTLDTSELLGAPTLAQFPRGLGVGPADVSLRTLLDDGTTGNLTDDLLRVRYGRDGAPGISDTLDGKALYRFTGYPDGLTGRHFGSPLDLYGRMGLGFLDNTGGSGSPLEAWMPNVPLTFTFGPDPALDDQLVDSPYEIDLSLSGVVANDGLFTAADLERILRPDDRDSILLSNRLMEGDSIDRRLRVDPNDATSALVFLNTAETFLDRLLEDSSTLNANQRDFARKLLTTHSFEVPAIPVDINRRLFDNLTVPVTERAALMGLLLSPEVRRGLPMNINRIFGDGIDNDGDGIVDEVGESEEPVAGIGDDPTTPGIDQATDVDLDVDNDGAIDGVNSGLLARNNFARRLFVLMVLLTEYEDRNGDGTIDAASDFFDFDGDGNTDQNDWLVHRRMLAQWCANVVDFRDPDSIMTGIEFDLNPFDGWDVDGDLSSPPETLGTFPGTTEDNYFVAWGTERPELLITETSALHDRRTQDREDEVGVISQGMASSTMPTNGDPADEEFDSLFVPNASAFFEIHNPWLSSVDSTPVELSDPSLDVPGPGVDLTLVDPDDTPVWRLLIVDPAGLTGAAAVARYSADFEAQIDEQLGLLGAAGTSPAISRIVYFTNPTAAATTTTQFTGERVYYPAGGGVSDTPVVDPGQYAVIGSAGSSQPSGAFATYIGRRDSDVGMDPLVSPTELDMTQRIELDPDGNRVTVTSPMATSNATASVFAINTVANDGAGNSGSRSLGLSDPIEGYARATGIETMPIIEGDGFFFVDATGMPQTSDVPVDEELSGDWSQDPINRNGLTTGYRIALLQRLADPTVGYDEDVNPYRTIDSSSVDLFAFNGLADDSAIVTSTAVAEGGTAFRPDALGTFERGELRTVPAEGEGLLWRTSVAGETLARRSDAIPGATAPGEHMLDQPYVNSLGELNDFYANNASSNEPFPWLTWNNRPFANQYEMVNVPYTSPGWLTRVFGVATYGAGSGEKPFSANTHAGAGGTSPGAGDLFFEFNGDTVNAQAIRTELQKTIHPNAVGFMHLLNFAAEDDGGTPISDRMHAVMDFLEVPSRFAGTSEYVNTDAGGGGGGLLPELTDATALEDFGYLLSAPFDELSTYRYPGKVNLNTISSPRVWNALLGSRDPATPGPYATAFNFTAWTGTLDGNPFRPATASNYTSETTVPGTANAGLYRSADADRTNGIAEDVESDFVPATQLQSTNTDRNAYFRNGLRQRLGGVATNRSSVFAIWVTVGYFEWDIENDVLFDRPGGGIEYGTETGTAERSRGFFIFDRSIPMAYEPGEDHNIDRGILLQSLIE